MQTTTTTPEVKATYTMYFKSMKLNGKKVSQAIIYSNGILVNKFEALTMEQVKKSAQPLFDAYRKSGKVFIHLEEKKLDNMQERLFNAVIKAQNAGKISHSTGAMICLKRYTLSKEELAAKVEELENM